MNNTTPVPYALRLEFLGYMDAHNDPDASDGAWFTLLEQAADWFLQEHQLPGCYNSAVHQYLRWVAEDEQEDCL